MRRYLFALGLSLFLGGGFNAALQEFSFAMEEPGQDQLSLEVFAATPTELFCTAFPGGGFITRCADTPQDGTGAGFFYSQHMVLLNKKTGDIWIQSVESNIETVTDPSSGRTATRRLATGKIKNCLLGKFLPEFVANSFQYNQSQGVMCPPPSDATPSAALERELPVQLLSRGTIKNFCTEFTNSYDQTCAFGFPYSDQTIFLDKETGNVWMHFVQTVEETLPPNAPTHTRLRATGKIRSCLLGKWGREFSASSLQDGGALACP